MASSDKVVLAVAFPRDSFDAGRDLPVVSREGTEVTKTQAEKILKVAEGIQGLRVHEVKPKDQDADQGQQVSGSVTVTE